MTLVWNKSMIVTMTILLTMNDGVYVKTRVAMMILMILILISMTSTLAMTVILVMICKAMRKRLLCDLGRLLLTIMIMSVVTLVTMVLMMHSIVARSLFGSPADLSSHPSSGVYHYEPLGASATSSTK